METSASVSDPQVKPFLWAAAPSKRKGAAQRKGDTQRRGVGGFQL